jgi:hypothetical protein
MLKLSNLGEKDCRGINFLNNTLLLVQQTLKYESFNFLDFCTQLRGRVLGDAAAKDIPELQLDEMMQN